MAHSGGSWLGNGNGTITVKELKNIKMVLNHFLKSQGFDDNLMELESHELVTILNRHSYINDLDEEGLE